MPGPARQPLIEGGPLRLAAMLAASWILLAVQSVVAAHPPVRFDLGTLCVVYFALESTVVGGAVASFFVAYLADLFSGEARGLTAAAMTISFLVVRLAVVRSRGARWLMITVVSLAGTALTYFARLFVEGWVGPDEATTQAAAPALPWLLLGAVVFGYPVYRWLRFVDHRFHPREEEAVRFRTLAPRRRIR